jgi:hypothetical protein
VRQQGRAVRRQPDWAGTARAVEHWSADDAFQGGDLLADRRLCVAQLLCGPTERACFSDRDQGQQVPQLQARPGELMVRAISCHDGNQS